MKFTQKIIIYSVALACIACNLDSTKSNAHIEKQWAYFELTTESKTDTSEYFYYAQINKSLLHDIETNPEKKGLFTLSNIRFVNDDGLLELYEDSILSGDIIFRIKDIREIILYKDDPVQSFDIKELHPSAKKIRKRKQ